MAIKIEVTQYAEDSEGSRKFAKHVFTYFL
jgi:hypothetical protein